MNMKANATRHNVCTIHTNKYIEHDPSKAITLKLIINFLSKNDAIKYLIQQVQMEYIEYVVHLSNACIFTSIELSWAHLRTLVYN